MEKDKTRYSKVHILSPFTFLVTPFFVAVTACVAVFGLVGSARADILINLSGIQANGVASVDTGTLQSYTLSAFGANTQNLTFVVTGLTIDGHGSGDDQLTVVTRLTANSGNAIWQANTSNWGLNPVSQGGSRINAGETLNFSFVSASVTLGGGKIGATASYEGATGMNWVEMGNLDATGPDWYHTIDSGSTNHTTDSTGSLTLAFSPSQVFQVGGLTGSDTAGRVKNFAFRIRIVPPDYRPYITAGSVHEEYPAVSAAGRYFYNATFPSGNRPEGVAVRIVDNHGIQTIFTGAYGPDTASVALDLGLVVPSDSITIAYGLSGSENPTAWSSTLDQKAATWSTDWIPPTPSPINGVAFTQTDAMSGDFPLGFQFRNDTQFNNQNSNMRRSFAKQTVGWISKFLSEYDDFRYPGDAQYYAEQLPNRLFVEHYLNNNVGVAYQRFSWFSRCHFAYYVGSSLSNAVTAGATSLSVGNGALYKVNDIVVIVAVDGNGARLWSQSEFARVTAINGNTLTVVRGVYGSTGTAFAAGSYVAPSIVRYDSSVTKEILGYNHSTMCPRDSQGRDCNDVIVAALHDLFSSDIDRVHGLVWDVPAITYSTDGRTVDANVDGIGDNGLMRGVNTFALGCYELNRKMRLALGEARCFMGDGYYGDAEDARQQCLGLYNGIEHDCNTDHTLKELSSAMNVYRLYEQFCTRPRFNFFVRKDGNLDGFTDQEKRMDHLRKNAMSTILGAGVGAGTWPQNVETGLFFSAEDEFRKGASNQLQWLGAPVGDIKRPALSAADLLGGAGVTMTQTFVDAWTSTDADTAKNSDVMVISDLGGDDTYGTEDQTMNITYSGVSIGAGGLLIDFDVKAEKLTYYPEDLARVVMITISGSSNWATNEPIRTWAVNSNYFHSSAYFRDAGPATVAITLTFQGRQTAYLKNFVIRNATEVLAREFKSGVVLCNANTNAYTFNLSTLFPGLTLRRLTASAFETNMTGIDTGELVGSTVQVPAQQGLFLIKEGGANLPPAFAVDPFTKTNATEDSAYSSSILGEASDPNPGDTLTFSKVSGPPWLSVASNGALSGTPLNADVGLNQFVVRVTDAGGLTDDATMNITVIGSNAPPTLTAIADRTIIAGQTLTITNQASDIDLPAQALSFSLLNAPGGATIDAASGVFQWRPAIEPSPRIQSFAVKVADNGFPSLSATQSFQVTVNRPVKPAISTPKLSAGRFNFTISGDSGPDYTILASTNLIHWSSVGMSNSPLLPFFFSDPGAANLNRRFYRVLLGP